MLDLLDIDLKDVTFFSILEEQIPAKSRNTKTLRPYWVLNLIEIDLKDVTFYNILREQIPKGGMLKNFVE